MLNRGLELAKVLKGASDQLKEPTVDIKTAIAINFFQSAFSFIFNIFNCVFIKFIYFFAIGKEQES